MKERPILFSTSMVRSILSGSKTQTRRIMKAQPVESPDVALVYKNRACTQPVIAAMWYTQSDDGSTCCLSPYGVPGDRLWVRETFIQGWPCIDGNPDQYNEDGSEKPIHTWYRASDPGMGWTDDDGGTAEKTPWKPSIFMPRTASRITLEVTGVRVERLQDISEADAWAEGTDEWRRGACSSENPRGYCVVDYYRMLWEQINGAGSWDLNPYVWVIEFKRVAA